MRFPENIKNGARQLYALYNQQRFDTHETSSAKSRILTQFLYFLKNFMYH